MQREHAKKLRLIYGIVLAVYTVIVGVLFIVSCADIYYSAGGGEGMYSRELVGSKLYSLLIPSIIWIVAVIAGYVISVLCPVLPEKKKAKRDELTALKKLRSRMPEAEGEEFLAARQEFKKGELVRIIVWSVCAAVWLASAIASSIYIFNVAHFPAVDFNSAILAMLKNVFPWFGASFLLCCGALVFEIFYARKALPQMKKLIVLGKGSPIAQPSKFAQGKSAVLEFLRKEDTVMVLRLVLLLFGTAFVVLGIFNGGMTDVLQKAIKICTECIGLG